MEKHTYFDRISSNSNAGTGDTMRCITKRTEFIYMDYLPAICSPSLCVSLYVCVCAPLLFLYSNVLKMITSIFGQLWGLLSSEFHSHHWYVFVAFICDFFYFVRLNRRFYLFSCYFFNLMEQKTIAIYWKTILSRSYRFYCEK